MKSRLHRAIKRLRRGACGVGDGTASSGVPSGSRHAGVALVEGHVLIWAAGGVTYCLETRLDMEAAVQIAESLR